MKFKLQDSGKREVFKTKAIRDLREGKGRYDLISPIALARWAKVYEMGAKKYSDRNWERGMNIMRYLDSAIRHTYQYIEGLRDEDHLGQAMWNISCAIHTEEMIERGLLSKELDDRPDYIKSKKKKFLFDNEINNAVDDINVYAKGIMKKYNKSKTK